MKHFSFSASDDRYLRRFINRNVRSFGPFPGCAAEDVIQAAILTLLKQQASNKQISLKDAANNACNGARGVDEKRRQRGKAREQVTSNERQIEIAFEEVREFDLKEQMQFLLGQVHKEFRRLTAIERSVLELRCAALEPTFDEIGRQLGISKQAAQRQYERARAKLARALESLTPTYQALCNDLDELAHQRTKRMRISGPNSNYSEKSKCFTQRAKAS